MPANPTSGMGIAGDGWRLGLQAVIRLPRLFITGFVVFALAELVFWQLGYSPWHTSQADNDFVVWTVISQLAPTLMIAPVIIGVHRLVILNDTSDHPVWRVPNSYGMFVRWLLIIDFATILPTIAGALLGFRESWVFMLISFLYSVLLATSL